MIVNIIASACSLFILISCSNNKTQNSNATGTSQKQIDTDLGSTRNFRGALTGGFKGDSIFFDVNADGTKLENLTFKGYWRCDGKLEMLSAAGPEGSFTLVNNKVDDHISEPPNGGATAWRFDLNASINGKEGSGTFRMNINGLGCNTGMLKWTAVAD